MGKSFLFAEKNVLEGEDLSFHLFGYSIDL